MSPNPINLYGGRIYRPRQVGPTDKRPTFPKTHPKDTKQWPKRGIAKPPNAKTCKKHAKRLFFACVCILGFCNPSLRPLFCIFLGWLFLHSGRFAVGPACLGDASVNHIILFCILVVLQSARPVCGMHLLITWFGDIGSSAYLRSYHIHPISS